MAAMVNSPRPEFGDIWTGRFPFADGSGEKHRTLLVLGFNPTRQCVFAVKITSTYPRTVYAGQLGIYRGDRGFAKTNLQKDCKLDFNELVELPLAKLTKHIGHLDIDDQRTAQRCMAAIQGSRYADEIAAIGRRFG